jgi:predicted lactoylglutathione lyase
MSKASIPTLLFDGFIYSLNFSFSFCLVVLLISVCQSFQGFTSSSTPTSNSPESVAASLSAAKANETNQRIKENEHQGSHQKYYQSENRFRFFYPSDFIVDDIQKNLAALPAHTPEVVIELWQQQKYEAIKNGAYADGTELPPNVQITVYRNLERLSLQGWIEQSERFVQASEVQRQTIAGQEALAFSSSGLYEHKNIIFSGLDGTEIIVISLAKLSLSEIDAPNERAFEQILSTFTLL